MKGAQESEALKRWRETPAVTRKFVGGCIDGEEREHRGDYRRTVRGDVYELRGDVMVYQFTRRPSGL